MHETERLKLVPYSSHFFQSLSNLFCKNENVMKMTLKHRTFTKKEFSQLLEENFILSTDDKFGFLCILSKGDDEIIGVSGLLKCQYLDKEDIEFGFILNDTHWGKGFAQEIGNFWINHAKFNLQLKRIIATTERKNHASRKVLDKLQLKFHSQVNIKSRGNRLIFIKNLTV